MLKLVLEAVDRPDVTPLPISGRLRSQLVYFASPGDATSAPELGEGEFVFNPADVDRWLADGVIALISPLDTANQTEVELSEEQEGLLQWLQDHHVEHARVHTTTP